MVTEAYFFFFSFFLFFFSLFLLFFSLSVYPSGLTSLKSKDQTGFWSGGGIVQKGCVGNIGDFLFEGSDKRHCMYRAMKMKFDTLDIFHLECEGPREPNSEKKIYFLF